jgi:hypothetical protein
LAEWANVETQSRTWFIINKKLAVQFVLTGN